MMKKILCTIILLWLLVPGWAQEFKVASFRLLPNDITAWVNPVRDLNDEACALIKVVGNRDFAFSTPLGIVQRKNEEGEIWLYVPNGTRKITIKHPRWGVLRDYKFPVTLESRLTYELVIEEPLLKVEEEYPRVRKVHRPLPNTTLDESLQAMPTSKLKSQRPAFTSLLTIGWDHERPAFGVMLACMKKHG